MIFLLSVAVSISCSLCLCRSPLLLGLWVLVLAFIVAFLLGILTFSWIGLLIFLIYVGGLLVMFAYFVALRPNQIFFGKGGFGVAACGGASLFFFFLFFFLLDGVGLSYEEGRFINYLLLYNNIFFFVLLSIVLFFALVSVVKLCSSYRSPLRPFSRYV